MKTVHIWKGSTKLNLTHSSSDKVPQDPIKIGSIGETLFILDSSNTIWFGQICQDFTVKFSVSYLKAVDFVCTRNILYFLSDHGKVYKIYPENLEKTFEVVLFEEAKSCAHGHTTNSKHIFVKSISAGSMGVLFLSDTGHLWVCGEHPQLDIHKDDEPTKVGFFEGRHITSASSGRDFNVVITHKRESGMCSTTYDEVTKSDEGNVFSTACPQCVSDNIISPLSPQTYCDTCPLGLHVSNDSPSPSTPTSRNNTIASEDRNNDNDNTSSSTEEDSCSIVRDEKCSPEVKEEDDSISVIVEKGDGMGLLHINTESARQFLTRQLSWVSSGGEELLAEVSVPTKIIKQNVSNVASFVYEGVKTVGDKVATLSRHMSGGSENNSDSFDDFVTDEFNLSHASNTSSIKCEWSCSGACSEVSDRGIAERLALILARGARLVKTELWTWGSVQHGQLGTGDMVKRHRPVLVNQLLHGGVERVVCGDSHCLAVTLTGMCYVWGANECGQVNVERKGEDISSPLPWGHVLRVAAGARHSVLIASNHSLHWLGKYRNEEMDDFDLLDGEIPLHALCCGEFTCIVAGTLDSDVASSTDLASEQCFLEEMLAVQSSVLKPLARRSNLDDMISTLSSRYTDLLQLTAVNVASMSQGMSSFKLLQDHIEEYLQVYEVYLTSVCNMIAMSGFNQLARVVEIPSKLVSIFSDRLPSRKTSPEAILTCAFTHPLNRVSVYKMMLSRGQSPVPAEATKWEEFCDRQDLLRKQADSTRLFWESCGRLVDSLRTPGRRLVRESRSHPLSVQNVSRFSSQWLILLSDTLVYVSGNSQVLYNLDTLWVDTIPDNETLQNVLVVTTPEDTLTLVAPSPSDKTDWLRAFQNTIKTKLNKLQAPSARTASYTFTKHTTYKDATYTGRWVTGKMEGPGRLVWTDGRVYSGQFHCNLPHGLGQLESPGLSVYEGQWKDGLQNGLGTTRYENGDLYKGYYKDGLSCGHGVRKSGSFIQSNTATVYVGEWVNGLRQGYGVMDDIFTGEKYLGSWSNNLKNGTGLIVTLEGIYYEGVFVQDVLTGHGVMVFEDGTHYEGELRAAGLFGGRGTLTFSTGDRFEGTLHGSWNEGIKITGTLHKNMPNCTPQRLKSKPSSFGKLCVPPHQKWKAIFRQCWVALGAGPDAKTADTQRAWDNIAVALTSQPASLHRHHESLLTIPQFGRLSLDSQSYHSICTYLSQAFESNYHPLGIALRELTEAYNATYGGQVHLLLLTHAVEELHSIADRLYQLVCLLFPALPPPARDMQLPDNDKVVVSLAGTLHPILLPRFHSALFELYALHNKTEDICYWKRLIKWNKQPNSTLMAFLGIDRKFWFGGDENQQIGAEHHFSTAVETLQQLKTTFCPLEKLMVIQNTFEQMTKVVRSELGPDYLWTMDELFPVFVFVVVRSCISQLGSEIHFIEDFMEPRLANGEPGIMFTTLKAGYCLILQEKITIGS